VKYVHVRQESQDREMELFEAKNMSETRPWSGFGPVGTTENREIEESTGKRWEDLSDRKRLYIINGGRQRSLIGKTFLEELFYEIRDRVRPARL